MSDTNTIGSLRQRMIEDMVARKLGPHSQRSHIYSCKRFAAYLKRSPETATADDVRNFQRSLIEDGTSDWQSQPDHDRSEVPSKGDAAPARSGG